MSEYRSPDWHQRLREMEKRADNLTTDVSRLWQMAPQAPEMPGFAMPVIIPDVTTPPPTTTTTSTTTSSTTTSTTSTTSTSTTPPPTMCAGNIPKDGSVVVSGVGGCPQLNGTFNFSNIFSCVMRSTDFYVIWRAPIPAGGYFDVRCYGYFVATGGVLNEYVTFDVWYSGTPPNGSPQFRYIKRVVPSGIFNLAQLKTYIVGQTFSLSEQLFGQACSPQPSSITLNFGTSL